MKRTLSLILAALILGTSMTACGKTEPNETKAETSAPETAISETDIDETNAPAAETEAPDFAYVTDRITENGVAKAHIVLFDGADQVEKYASEELITHIKLVSGAEIAVTNEVQTDSLPIIIATPDSYPELETLFPEDLAWLRDTGNPDEDVRYGSDGFAIRMLDGKLYIFGAEPRGALNGVYDFIEDNMGVLWTRAEDMSEVGTIYDEMPTITLTAVNYREKSPFDLRAWTLSGNSAETQILFSRNKLNGFATIPAVFLNSEGKLYEHIGMESFITNHNITWWILTSPSYDPNCTEYWSTTATGDHVADFSQSEQVNVWSDVTVQCLADSVLSLLDKYYESTGVSYIGICLEDLENFNVIPEMNEPYEYAEGQFVDPKEINYDSTVFFSFLNKVARIVGEKYPDVIIHSYAYANVIETPSCELEKNVGVTFCPVGEDFLNVWEESSQREAQLAYQSLLGWMEKTSNIQVYNYYGFYVTVPIFERTIWNRIQSDLQFYAANGLNGLVPEGFADCSGAMYTHFPSVYTEIRKPFYYYDKAFSVNALTYWLYAKLAWNPNEDVAALVKYYCDKAYGDASEYMQEYYRLIQLGMEEGRQMMAAEFNLYYHGFTDPIYYWDYFLDVEVDGVNIVEEIQKNLHKAYEAANDIQKKRIEHIVEVYDNGELLFAS